MFLGMKSSVVNSAALLITCCALITVQPTYGRTFKFPKFKNVIEKQLKALFTARAALHHGGPAILLEAQITGLIRKKPLPSEQNYELVCYRSKAWRYRTADGTCNHAFNYGRANVPERRLLPAEYDDANGAPRTLGQSGRPLPSPIVVSEALHYDKEVYDQRTVMVMQFGQFLSHDIILTPVSESKDGALKCCGPNRSFPATPRHSECFPMRMDTRRFFGQCMEFTRSLPARDANDKLIEPREQVNLMTSFVDGSMIYGNSEAVQSELRYSSPFARAYLRLSQFDELLPKATNPNCMHRPKDYCFMAGDPRVNEHPGLAVMHTVWVKLHNRIAFRLQKLRGADQQDELFQLTQKIVVAILQHILYKEYLPSVLGKRVMSRYGLWPGKRMKYDSEVDPRIFNSFACGAFRFGHSTIPRYLVVKGTECNTRKLLHRPDMVFDNFTGVLESLIIPDTGNDGSQRLDPFMVDEVTAHLFEPADQIDGAPSRGLDLAALNIQRGRDHGLPPFNSFRKFCGRRPFSCFDKFGPELSKKLAAVYEDVDDVDLFSGGLAEPPEEKDYLGPTFACLVAKQFHDLKYGDRFFYETTDVTVGFNDAQLKVIRKMTLAHVLCSFTSDDEFNSGDSLREVQKNVFLIPSKKNSLQSCQKLRKELMDSLKFWQIKYDRKYEDYNARSDEEQGTCKRKSVMKFLFHKRRH